VGIGAAIFPLWHHEKQKDEYSSVLSANSTFFIKRVKPKPGVSSLRYMYPSHYKTTGHYKSNSARACCQQGQERQGARRQGPTRAGETSWWVRVLVGVLIGPGAQEPQWGQRRGRWYIGEGAVGGGRTILTGQMQLPGGGPPLRSDVSSVLFRQFQSTDGLPPSS